MAEDSSPYRFFSLNSVRCEDELCPKTGRFLYSRFSWFDPKHRAYSGQIKRPSVDLTIGDIMAHLNPIADNTAYPPHEGEWMVVAEDEDEHRLHIKRPNLLRLKNNDADARDMRMKLMDEIVALERIRQHHPHPNYVAYYGVTVWRGHATSIVQERFAVTLANRLRVVHRPLNVASVIGRIRATLGCLHRHGLAHNRVTAENIGLTADDEPKLLNFSCCKPFGEKLVDPGAVDVSHRQYGLSAQVHDLNGLDELRAWLETEHAKYHSPAVVPAVSESPCEYATLTDETDGWGVVSLVKA